MNIKNSISKLTYDEIKTNSTSINNLEIVRSHPLTKRALIVITIASAFFVTFVSPQISLLGRGLITSLPLFILMVGFLIVLTTKKALRKIRIYIPSIFLGIAFVFYGIIQNFLQPDADVFHAHVTSMAICIMIWIAITLLRGLFPSSLEAVRWIVLIVFSISLGVGIPLLIQNPGIARLTAGGNPFNPNNEISLYLSGVANYTWYTPIAIAWPAIANWINNKSKNFSVKLIAWGLLALLSLAVIFSTFTMALVILGFGIAVWILLNIFMNSSYAGRFLAIGVLLILIVLGPVLYQSALNLTPTALSTAKATILISGILSNNLVYADGSGRVTWLIETIPTFLKNPIFGAWGFDKSNYFVTGHSSWGAFLGLQGLLGLGLWFGFLSPSWRRRKQPLSVKSGVAGGTLSWILFGLAGILNPIFGSQVTLLLIWLFDEGGIWQIQRKKYNTKI